MIPLLIYAQMADLVTLLFAADALGFEGNEYGPLAQVLYGSFGMAGVAAAKIAFLTAFVAIGISWRQKHPRFFATMVGFAIVMGTTGALINVAALAVSV